MKAFIGRKTSVFNRTSHILLKSNIIKDCKYGKAAHKYIEITWEICSL